MCTKYIYFEHEIESVFTMFYNLSRGLVLLSYDDQQLCSSLVMFIFTVCLKHETELRVKSLSVMFMFTLYPGLEVHMFMFTLYPGLEVQSGM